MLTCRSSGEDPANRLQEAERLIQLVRHEAPLRPAIRRWDGSKPSTDSNCDSPRCEVRFFYCPPQPTRLHGLPGVKAHTGDSGLQIDLNVRNAFQAFEGFLDPEPSEASEHAIHSDANFPDLTEEIRRGGQYEQGRKKTTYR